MYRKPIHHLQKKLTHVLPTLHSVANPTESIFPDLAWERKLCIAASDLRGDHTDLAHKDGDVYELMSNCLLRAASHNGTLHTVQAM